MVFEIVFKPPVFIDVEEAIEYYNKQSADLGIRFYHDFLDTINKIQLHPTHYLCVYKSVRRCVLSKFPYKVFFMIEAFNVVIIGVAHAKRSAHFIGKRL